MKVEIISCENGFLVTEISVFGQCHNESKRYVFETYDALFDGLREIFGTMYSIKEPVDKLATELKSSDTCKCRHGYTFHSRGVEGPCIKDNCDCQGFRLLIAGD